MPHFQELRPHDYHLSPDLTAGIVHVPFAPDERPNGAYAASSSTSAWKSFISVRSSTALSTL